MYQIIKDGIILMAHTVLARKWRPKKFTDLVGQQNTVTILKNIITTNRLHHAYLLTGTRGVGKTTIARIIAKALNCLNLTDNEPCCNCNNCLQIDSGRYVDVIEIDAASNTGVDNIREVLENAQYAPTSGQYKIYIIDEVHMLSKSAFNAMLKTLEEPPAHIVFILATTDPQKVPVTILSRCLQLKLRNMSIAEIETHLAWILQQESINYEIEALSLLANAANGSMRDALSLTDQAIAFSSGLISKDICQQMLGISDDSILIQILEAIYNKDTRTLTNICEHLNNEGANLENLLAQINYTLFQIGLAQLSPQPNVKPELLALAGQISVQDCQLYFEISNLGIEQIKKVTAKYPVFVMSLLRMIAFSIGSSEQKQVFVSNGNFNSTPIDSTQEPKLNPDVQKVEQHITITNTVLEENISSSHKHVTDIPKEDAKTDGAPPWQELREEASSQIPADTEAEIMIAAQEVKENATQDMPLTAAFDGDWIKFIKQIDYNRFPTHTRIGMVLNNSQLEHLEGNTITLSVDDKFREAVTHECVDLIEKILYETYQQHYDLEFNFSQTLETSIRIHEVTTAREKQQQAEESIKNDPIIKDLIDNFSAKIIPNSIKPID